MFLPVQQHALASNPSHEEASSRVSIAEARRESLPAICGVDHLERGAALRAEQRLLVAVLQEAVHTFQRYADSGNQRGRRLFREADAWFSSNDTTCTFSFVPLCDAVGFDPTYLRSGLRRWRAASRTASRSVYRFYHAAR